MNALNRTALAVQCPAPCGLSCAWCRTPNHGEGNPEKVLTMVKGLMAEGGVGELYLTANGTPSKATIFTPLVDEAMNLGIPVAVLCNDADSVRKGLVRVEVSLNPYTRKGAELAIAKAKSLNIPLVISWVDTGIMPLDPRAIAEQWDADGVIVRALQAEGRSHKSAGQTKLWHRQGVHLGHFPVPCYRELEGFGQPVISVNHWGDIVPHLGGN